MKRTVLTAVVGIALALTPANAAAKKPQPPGGGGGGTPSTTSTYVKNYANVVNGVEYGLTPEGIQTTVDGGWIASALTQAPGNGVGVTWLLKSSAVGAPQWQEEIGCLSTPPGDYSDEVSLQRTSDGGYVLAGGTVGCGSGTNCPSTSGIQCGLIEKLDSTGSVIWAQVYAAGAAGTSFRKIEQTSDGGYIAVGTATDLNQNTGALIVKLDGQGNIQWQRELGPTATSQAYFNDVLQTADGGYIAAGELNTDTYSSTGSPLTSALAVKFDPAGNVSWQRGFNDIGATGVTATEHVNAIVQTSDGGYAIGGNWASGTYGSCCTGALLLKVTADGSIQWQAAYSGGVICSDQSCNDIGGVVYSLHQTADGGYVLAGDAASQQFSITPWLAKVDASGTLVWQDNDYQALASTGAPLSQYFASSTLTATGPLAIGSTENYSNGLDELLGIQTDANGNVGTCSQIHPATALAETNPGLASFAPGLTTTTSIASQSPAPVQRLTTAATATPSQC